MDSKATATATANAASRATGPIRVAIPVSVAFNLDKLQKVLANLATSVGHSACLSGADCTLLNVRDWLVDPASLDIHEAPVQTMGGVR